MIPPKKFLATTVIIAVLLLLGGSAAAAGIETTYGSDVPLSGYATSGPYVYLFLTGPNLPENGVALHDITKRADQGGFTRVSVDGDDRWSYAWHTASINGRLDEGTYMIWVVSGPNDRSRLAQADFRTIAVTLGKPYVAVDTPVQPGGMDLTSVPDGASVMVGGEYRGKTPLRLTGLPPGSYAVAFSRFGYTGLSTQVTVQGGKISEVVATLRPDTGTLSVNSVPPGARLLLDGADAGLSPAVLANISSGNHTIRLEKEGYTPVLREVKVTAGQESTLEVTLDPVPVPPATARAAGLVPAMAGAGLVILAGIACRIRRNP